MARTSPRKNPSNTQARGEDLGLSVRLIHHDGALAILEKPAGLLSARMGDQVGDSIFDVVKAWAKIDGPASRSTGPKRGADRDSRPAWIIHRLDREVSGVMVFALTGDAFLRLKDDLQTRRVARRYAAVVEGEIPKGESGIVSGFLADAGPAKKVLVLSDAQVGAREVEVREEIEDDALAEPGRAPKRAVTHWKCVASGRGRSLLEVRLETGRKHQIRAHMASMGHPICGDKLYGSKDAALGRIGLHAADLRLAHPLTGIEMSWYSPVPREFFIAVGEEIGAWPPMSVPVPAKPVSIHAKPKLDAVAIAKAHKEANPELAGAAPVRPAAVAPAVPAVPAPKVISAGLVATPAGMAFKAKVEKVAKPEEPKSPIAKTEPRAHAAPKDEAGWDHVAPWYDDLLSKRKSDHHEELVLPSVIRLLAPKKGERALDVACGEGGLIRRLAAAGVAATGVDASPQLIQAARATRPDRSQTAETSFLVGDARKLGAAEGLEGPFDMASCVLALMNIDPLAPVLSGVANLLKRDGRFVAVMLHPAFRSPGQTHWGEQGQAPVGARHFRKPGMPGSLLKAEAELKARKAGGPAAAPVEFKMFRKVEGYLSPDHHAVVMNPGAVAKGADPISTVTWHRPIQTYVAAFAKAGLLIDALEEWTSLRESEPGPRAHEENRVRREIPMFLAIRGVRK